jgi:hypothetical protein
MGLYSHSAERGSVPRQKPKALSTDATLHALRRTCASVLVALGKDPRYVMAQLGHTDPTVTLGIYAQAMTSSDEDRERLRLLVEGGDLAVDDRSRGIGFQGDRQLVVTGKACRRDLEADRRRMVPKATIDRKRENGSAWRQ